MANIKGAMKRDRQSAKRHAGNVAAKTALKTERRKLFAAVESKNQELGLKECRAYSSMLDKLVKRGIITRNTAIRRKARATARVRKLGVK
ncbi:MAG: 30S ribosomal protein S20 [Kiritimatiellaeota bacterium]|nr:30S ribosomal protein S20 [Kiritimatiellota bacterium]